MSPSPTHRQNFFKKWNKNISANNETTKNFFFAKKTQKPEKKETQQKKNQQNSCFVVWDSFEKWILSTGGIFEKTFPIEVQQGLEPQLTSWVAVKSVIAPSFI